MSMPDIETDHRFRRDIVDSYDEELELELEDRDYGDMPSDAAPGAVSDRNRSSTSTAGDNLV